MFATAPATTRPARRSRGKEMMRTARPPVVDWLSLALQAASSDTSTSTTARIQASYAIVTDFFNGLLDRGAWSARNLLKPASQPLVLIGHRKAHCFAGEIDGHQAGDVGRRKVIASN